MGLHGWVFLLCPVERKLCMATFKTQVVSERQDGAVLLAVEELARGNLVAIPTETVYGLAADATELGAVQQIYAVKGRPSNNPLICHVADIDMAKKYVEISPLAEQLMQHFWPGPLTLVLPSLPGFGIASPVSAGLTTLAVRCPESETARRIIAKLGKPLAAPSANPSGKLSPTSANDVLAELGGQIPLIVDGGDTQVGIESAIIGVTDEKLTLLRPGSITADDITAVVHTPVFDRNSNQITAPGQLASHYAPTAKVRLNAHSAEAGEILIGFGEVAGDMNLSASSKLEEAAHNLFKFMRKADLMSPSCIAIAPIPNHGVGIAINDRLHRAAAPRNR